MRKSLRVFIAVAIPDEVARFLQNIRNRLQAPAMNIRWVSAGNIHLTLKFFGDIEASCMASIADRMDAVVAMNPIFSLQAGGVGGFPNLRNFRVLWVGLRGDTLQLKAIQNALESELEKVGFRKERRRFHPHLTIGRTRQRVDGKRFGALVAPLADATSNRFRVDRIHLFASFLKPGGAEYSRLHTSHLTGW